MNYIGSKDRLIHPLIDRAVTMLDIPAGRVGDAFAGTHAVGRYFQGKGFTVYANDLQSYSCVIGESLLLTEVCEFKELRGVAYLDSLPVEERAAAVIAYLNDLVKDVDKIYDATAHGAWFTDKYGEDGKSDRLYFSRENARRIQIIRGVIADWRLTYKERCVLLHALVAAADKVANVASVYYTYLKKLKKSAVKPLTLKAPPLVSHGEPASITRMDAVEFVDCTRGLRVLYLDPPYNERQYAPNYHLLETIVEWDDPEDRGKGGVRPYDDQKSSWCYASKAVGELRKVLYLTDAEYVIMSYSSEGIMKIGEIMDAMAHYGTPMVFEHEIPRFRSQKADEPIGDEMVTEYLICVRRQEKV